MGEKATSLAPFMVTVPLNPGHLDYLHYLVEIELYGHSDREWGDLKATTLVRELRELDEILTNTERENHLS